MQRQRRFGGVLEEGTCFCSAAAYEKSMESISSGSVSIPHVWAEDRDRLGLGPMMSSSPPLLVAGSSCSFGFNWSLLVLGWLGSKREGKE